MSRFPTPEQFRIARSLVKLGVRQVAKDAGCMAEAVHRLEDGRVVPASVASAVRAVLEAAGAEFIPEISGEDGVRLRNVSTGR